MNQLIGCRARLLALLPRAGSRAGSVRQGQRELHNTTPKHARPSLHCCCPANVHYVSPWGQCILSIARACP